MTGSAFFPFKDLLDRSAVEELKRLFVEQAVVLAKTMTDGKGHVIDQHIMMWVTATT